MSSAVAISSTSRRALVRRWFILTVLFGAAGFVAASAFFAVKFTARMPRAAGSFDGWLPASTESIRFPSTDGVSLAGWFVPHENATRAVVLLHGHGSHRRQMLARAKFLHAQGFAVLLYDARGHGESDGDRVSIGWFETRDLLGALDYLRRRGFHDFGLIGESMGGATITLAARELRDVKWIVLESVYPTLRDAVDRRFRKAFGVPWLARCGVDGAVCRVATRHPRGRCRSRGTRRRLRLPRFHPARRPRSPHVA